MSETSPPLAKKQKLITSLFKTPKTIPATTKTTPKTIPATTKTTATETTVAKKANKETTQKVAQTAVTKPKGGGGGHWTQGLQQTLSDPGNIIKETDHVCIIKDKFPKAQHHYLLVHRTIPSLATLRSEHVSLLEHMITVGVGVNTPFFGVYLQIKKLFYSGAILYEETELEEKNQNNNIFFAVCWHFL